MDDIRAHIGMSEPVSPAQAIYDSGYGSLTNVVFQREFSLGIAAEMSANNVIDIVVGKLSVGSRHDSCRDSMVVVSDASGPFEIGPDVVPLDSIKVVNLNKVVRVWNERFGDKLMDRDIPLQRGGSQVDINVSTFVGEEFHFLAKMPLDSVSFGAADAIETSHPPHVADFVKCSVLGDGNGSPFFSEYRVHQGNLSLEMPASFNMAYAAIQDGDVRCL